MAPTQDTTSDLGKALKRARRAAGFSNAKAFLAAVKVEMGTAPSYSTYAQWESGEVSPREASLEVVQRFHEARGTWVQPETAPDLASALVLLAKELTELRLERQEMIARVSQLEATVELLVGQTPVGSGTAERAALAAPGQ